ncbi:MAG: HEAT repeat domain-containing protein, partial [Polyangiaceae bacterium]
MAESGLARGLFWKAWALSALLATVIAGARLVSPRPAPVPRRERAAAPLARLERSVVVTQPMAASAPIEDGVLARLALAETASERCELLGRVEASADARVTYAITSVLDRAQLDSVRSCATQALSLQPTPEAGSWLIALSEDPAPAVYEIALRALASRDDVAARAELVEATHSENSELRQSAVTALLKAGREEGFSAALAVLPSIEDPESLSTLIDALGESHDPRALPVLLTLLDDADRASRLHAISALGELGIAAASARLESLLDLGSAEEFRAAAQALLKLEPERALLKLRLALTSTDADRQLFALAAIGNADLPGVVPILREQLDSGDERRARLVLRRLLRKPLPELEAELTRFAASDDTSLQMPALRALERLTTASARATVQRLTNADEDTGDHSIVALARDHSQTAQAEL